MEHTCCAWCTTDIHVYCAFVSEDIVTPEDFFVTFGTTFPAIGIEVLSLRRVNEADAHHRLEERRHEGKMTVVEADGSVSSVTPEIFGHVWQITYRDLSHEDTV